MKIMASAVLFERYPLERTVRWRTVANELSMTLVVRSDWPGARWRLPPRRAFSPGVEAEAAFKADLEKLLKAEGHMPEDRFLVMSRKGRRLGVAFASTPRGEGGARSLKFKIE